MSSGTTSAQPPSTQTTIQPYLFFGGRCDEALAFYTAALGAKVQMLMRFKESPQPVPPGVLAPGFEEKIMHSSFVIGQTTVMASDGCGPGGSLSGFSLSLTVPTIPEADRAFAALADGGKVQMPLNKTFFSPRYGMVSDKFGVTWIVIVLPH